MTTPRVVGGFDADAPSPRLIIAWDNGTERGAELPDAYFEEVEFAYTGQDMPPLAEVAYTATRELTVTFGDLSAYLSTHNTIFFALAFPDRVDFIACTHPASPDRYLLHVTMTFTPADDFIGAVFEQVTNRGGF